MDKKPQYPLTPSLTMLGMAIVLAWLVLAEGWTYWEATFTVVGFMLGLAALLLVLVIILAPRNQWRDHMQIALDTMKEDATPVVAVWRGIRSLFKR